MDVFFLVFSFISSTSSATFCPFSPFLIPNPPPLKLRPLPLPTTRSVPSPAPRPETAFSSSTLKPLLDIVKPSDKHLPPSPLTTPTPPFNETPSPGVGGSPPPSSFHVLPRKKPVLLVLLLLLQISRRPPPPLPLLCLSSKAAFAEPLLEPHTFSTTPSSPLTSRWRHILFMRQVARCATVRNLHPPPRLSPPCVPLPPVPTSISLSPPRPPFLTLPHLPPPPHISPSPPPSTPPLDSPPEGKIF